MFDKQELKELIKAHKRRLMALKERKALRGWDGPVDIDLEIEDIEEEIKDLSKQLKRFTETASTTLTTTIETVEKKIINLETHLNLKEVALETPPIESPYGTMRPTSPFYIEREADHNCWSYLKQTKGVTIFIQAPWQTGKSSLMQRMLYKAKQNYQAKTAFIDFQGFSESVWANEETFLIELCLMMGDALNIEEAIESYWHTKSKNNLKKCSNYLFEYILPQIKHPFILAMDEVQQLFNSPWRHNFFSMLRTWHNDPRREKLTLFLSSSTDLHLVIPDHHQSSFDLATTITLQDFNLTELKALNQAYQNLLDPAQLKTLMTLLDGHPSLTRQAMNDLARGTTTLTDLLQKAFLEDGPFTQALRHYWQQISQNQAFTQAIAQICQDQADLDDSLYYRLKAAGVIKKVSNQIVMRNSLYKDYFGKQLIPNWEFTFSGSKEGFYDKAR